MVKGYEVWKSLWLAHRINSAKAVISAYFSSQLPLLGFQDLLRRIWPCERTSHSLFTSGKQFGRVSIYLGRVYSLCDKLGPSGFSLACFSRVFIVWLHLTLLGFLPWQSLAAGADRPLHSVLVWLLFVLPSSTPWIQRCEIQTAIRHLLPKLLVL